MSQSEYQSVTIGHGKGKGAASKASNPSPSTASNKPAHVSALSAFIARGRKARGLLAHGTVVDIVTHDGSEVVASLPFALFAALSSSPNIVSQVSDTPRITLPTYILPVSIKDLISRITPFSDPSFDINPMSSTGDFFKDLHIASAAQFLGLTLYTQPMFNTHFRALKSHTPSPSAITAISAVRTPIGNNLFATITHDLATLYWDNALPDPAAFDAYCEVNTRVRDAVDALCAKWESDERALAAREERRVRVAKQQAKQQAMFAAKDKADAELGHVVRGKMRVGGSKFTAAEARYVWATFGKRVPV
jgi:hypothetical protein